MTNKKRKRQRNTPVLVIEARWTYTGKNPKYVGPDWHAIPVYPEYFLSMKCDAFRDAVENYRRWWIGSSQRNDETNEHPEKLELRVAKYQRIPMSRYPRLPGARHG